MARAECRTLSEAEIFPANLARATAGLDLDLREDALEPNLTAKEKSRNL